MATTGALNYDDLVALRNRPENEFFRLELIEGELFASLTPVPFHQRVLSNIQFALELVVRSRRPGIVFAAPLTVRFSPENVVEPDIVFIRRDRLEVVGDKVVDGAPDLVMEVLSPGTRWRDLNQKRALYERFGVREYWVIDPAHRSLRRFSLIHGRYVEQPAGETVVQSSVLPEFAISLDDVFEPPV